MTNQQAKAKLEKAGYFVETHLSGWHSAGRYKADTLQGLVKLVFTEKTTYQP